MPETPEDRPRPAPRPRPGAAVRPSPRPRVAGSRRDREDAEPGTSERTARPAAAARPRTRATATRAPAADAALDLRKPRREPRPTHPAGPAAGGAPARRRRAPALALALVVVCLLAAAGTGVLLWQRLRPPYVDAGVFSATRAGVEALYAYDYKDSGGSVRRKLAVLTGELRDQYQQDLSQGGIIDTYEQVSATTSYDVLDVSLQQVNDAQDAATLVVFGQYVVRSVNSGTQAAPQGSECTVTADGAQSCTQTVRVRMTMVDGDWKISELTLLTTS